MGACASALETRGNSTARGGVAMSSAESLATARAKTYANGIVLTGGSRTLVETWGLKIADGGEFSAFRYVDAEACRVSRDAKDLRGSSVNAAKTGELQLWYAQAAPIAMPVGRVEVNGGARVVSPRVHAVDVFVEVDGESFSDGHVCYGADAKSSRDEAINAACRDTPMSKTWMRDFLKNGPSDGTKPWATLVKSRGWTNEESCVYLPLMARDVDNALMGDDTLTYGHSLMDKWSRLLAKVGPGERAFTLRVRPRGVVFRDVRGEPQYDFVGETSGDASVKRKIIASFVGEHLTAADAHGMSASWTMTLDASQCDGRAPVRTAQEFTSGWSSSEIKTCIPIAMKLANEGPCGAMAKKMAPNSTCCHVILSDGERGSGVATATSDDGARTYDFFCAWALFKNADGKRDSLGAEIKFVCRRDDGEWRSTGFDSVAVDRVTGLTIANAEIDAAIARDARYH